MSGKQTSRPKRAAKPNRRFFDDEVWAHNVSVESLPSPKTPPRQSSAPASSTPTVALSSIRKEGTAQHSLATQTKPEKNNARNGARSKKFIRFRFQIDCTVAVDLDIDDLVGYLKANMKIEKRKNNLAEVTIERRSSNVHVLAKIILKKKYLKRLVKKYLKKKRLFKYRVLQKNKRAYKLALNAQS